MRESIVRRRQRSKFIMIVLCICLFLLTGYSVMKFMIVPLLSDQKIEKLGNLPVPEWISVELIGTLGTARYEQPLEDIKDIVIHYVGNPGTTAQQNRDFFNNPGTNVNSHFVVGLDGEIIQCLPLNEKSSASNWRNSDTISIEVCHPDDSGKFTDASYEALVRLTAWLCNATNLDESRVIRHYDITKKMCPIYYVENEEEWNTFKLSVNAAI